MPTNEPDIMLWNSTCQKARNIPPPKSPTFNEPIENHEDANSSTVVAKVVREPHGPNEATPHNNSIIQDDPEPSNRGYLGKEPVIEALIHPTDFAKLQARHIH